MAQMETTRKILFGKFSTANCGAIFHMSLSCGAILFVLNLGWIFVIWESALFCLPELQHF